MLKRHTILFAPDAAPASGAAPSPAAPAPAKAAPAAAAPTDAPSDKGEPTPSSGSDPFDDLDKKWEADQKAKEPAKDPPKEKADEPTDKTKEPPKQPDKKGPAPDDLATKTPKQLRERLQAVQTERDTNAKKISDYEKKISDLEKRGIDSTAATERLAALEKERDELKGQLRSAKFEVSEDFKKNHDEPYNRMAEDASAEIVQLQIADRVDNDGNTIPGRPATWNDFVELYHMDRTRAKKVAKEAFGEDYTLVMDHYDALKRLDRQRVAALKAEQSEFSERAKTDQANREKQQQFISSTWVKVNEDIVEKYAEFLKPDATKPERAKLLQESRELVDAKPQTLENKIIHDAQIRNRAIAFPIMRDTIQSLRKELAERDAKIAELTDSDPMTGKTRRVGSDGQPGGKTEEQELAEVFES